MSNKSQSTAIGGFVLGAAVLLIGAILLFAKTNFDQEFSRSVLFFDETLAGLDIGAPVVINGVKVGQVTEIEVITDVDNLEIYTPVYIEIYDNAFRQLNRLWDIDREENTRKIIEKGFKATLETQSLVTGKMQVSMEFRPEVPIKFKGIVSDIQEFPTAPNSFSVLTSKLQKLPLEDIANNVNLLVSNLNQVISKTDVQKTLTQFEQTLQTYKTVAETFNHEIKPIASEFKQTMDEYQELAVSINKKVPALTQSAVNSLANLERLLKSSEQMVKSIDTTYGDKSEMNYQLNITLQEISKAAHSIKLLTDYLERHPEALIYGKDNPN